MAFKNTVETVGDAALIRSIIDKSITELNCNITTIIRQHAFRACTKLAIVNFPNVTSVAQSAFWNCTALAKADFGSAVAFANNAFCGCTSLTALILRSTDQLCTITGTPFASSAIAAGTGYIYVPSALVDQYKAASGFSTYAAQIRAIEDYIEVVDPYSWAAVAKCIDNGTYKDVYKIGDLVPIFTDSAMQIVAFDTDDLADGSGKASITWIANKSTWIMRMNATTEKLVDGVYQEGTGSIGGWKESLMRTDIKTRFTTYVPDDVRAMVKTVKKYSNGYDTSGALVANVLTEDDVWIPSAQEMFGGTTYETSGAWYGEMFSNNSSRVKALSNWYWLRTAHAKNGFYAVESTTGKINNNNANGNMYAIFGFCT